MRLTKKKNFILISSAVIGSHLLLFFLPFQYKKEASIYKKPIIIRNVVSSPPSRTIPKPKTYSKTENTKKKTLLKQLKESLDTIEKTMPSKQTTPLTVPKIISSLEIDETKQNDLSDYFPLLTQILQKELELPEYGDVKLELTLLNNGKVSNIRILNAASEKNQHYLNLHLPKITFPPFNKDLKHKREYTFTLTFCNET